MEQEYSRRFPNNEIGIDNTSKQAHHKALFDSFNQALDLERPYKDKGSPAPWSKQTRVARKEITIKQLQSIFETAKAKVLAWCKTGAGTSLIPPPPAPPTNTNQDENPPPPQPVLQTGEERKAALREERLGFLMVKELDENEQKWIDYEDEDTQAKFDLADMVLEVLAGELAQFLHNK